VHYFFDIDLIGTFTIGAVDDNGLNPLLGKKRDVTDKNLFRKAQKGVNCFYLHRIAPLLVVNSSIEMAWATFSSQANKRYVHF